MVQHHHVTLHRMSLLPPLSDYIDSFRCRPPFSFYLPLPTVFLDSSVVPVLLHPLSRGRIRLKSKHFNDHPIIEPNYLHHPLDVTTLADACLTAMKRWAALQAPRRCRLAFISMITTAVCCCNLCASACSVRLHEPMKSIAGSLVGGMRVQQSPPLSLSHRPSSAGHPVGVILF